MQKRQIHTALLSAILAANDFARLALSATTILSLWFGRPFGAIYRKNILSLGLPPEATEPTPLRGLHKQDSEEQLMHRLSSIETVCSLYRTEVKSFAFPVAACKQFRFKSCTIDHAYYDSRP